MKHPVNWIWVVIAIVLVVGFVAGLWAWRTHSQKAQTEFYREEAIKVQEREGS